MKFPSVMKKPNPIEVMFKDKSKFDVQNPVVGSLITQVVDNKKTEKEFLRALDQAPSIKDLDIEKRFRELENFIEGRSNDDDDDDDDDNNTGQSPGGNLPPLQYPYHLLEETNHHFYLHHQFCQRLL